jgi:hypothetical protein
LVLGVRTAIGEGKLICAGRIISKKGGDVGHSPRAFSPRAFLLAGNKR